MNEFELFQAALDIDDPVARQDFVKSSCAGNVELHRRVETLLTSHAEQSRFLNVPVVEQIADMAETAAAATMLVGAGSTQDDEPAANSDHQAVQPHGAENMTVTPKDSGDETPLGYLEPTSRPDSLGRLGHYEVLEVIGQGAFGTVLRGFDEKLQRVVAIKVMSPEMASTSPARKRFIREAQASAAIRHENVVSVHAVEEKPIPYLVMDYIPGLNLQQRLDTQGPFDVSTVLRLGRQIAEGLAAAHAQDLIHRDVKPANILLETGAREMVKVTDFGLARAADDASVTQSGTIAGTPMYMAPEQALGKKLDQRADLFSFGSVLYQMLSGRPPFRAATTLAVLKRLNEDTPRPIREIIPEAPQWLCDIITKLHAKNPDDRYQSAREVADVLANCEFQLKAHSGLKDYSLIPVPARDVPKPARQWKRVTAAAFGIFFAAFAISLLLIPFFRPGEVKIETVNPGDAISVKTVTNSSLPDSAVWVQLFNGKDLTGWKFHPDHPGDWKVQGGILRGSSRQSHLFSDRGDYQNFHLRAEVKVSSGGDSGILFRAPFELRRGRTPSEFGVPGCYEVELQQNRSHPRPTGTVSEAPGDAPPTSLGLVRDRTLTQPDEWFTIEVIAAKNHFVTKINGIEAANCEDSLNRHQSGHLALQVWNANTLVQFRKIEILELPATPETLPPTFKNSIGMEFVIVPKGKSWLGGSKDRLGTSEVEMPTDFYLGKYEVTQEEWLKVMEENPSSFSRKGSDMNAVQDVSDEDLHQFPVESVSWENAELFLAKLNKLEGDTGWIYRLPRHIEWEYACRGGPTAFKADSAFDYYLSKPTNHLTPDLANVADAVKRTCRVGSYEGNSLGLCDMHGNVWEWCENIMDGSDRGLQNAGTRGGSWTGPAEQCSAARGNEAPKSYRDRNTGFRVARVRSDTTSSK